MAKQQQEKAQQAVATTTSTEPSLLEQAISATKQTAPDAAEGMIRALVASATAGQVSFDKNAIHTVKKLISLIDEKVSKQLSEVMHNERFQKLEGTWRGLHYLCKNSETNDLLKIKVLNCSKRELSKNLSSASGFDQSDIWQAIYEQEFGMPGGQPYGVLVGDYEFENHPEDIKLLEDVSGIAAGAFAPFITAPSAKFFGLESWQELPKLVDLRTTFDSKAYAKWKSFRESDDSRFVAMVMPRTLARYPYGANTQRVDEFNFEELPLNRDGESIAVSHDKYCWMNTAYVHAARMTAAFAETHFCTAIRGKENGGLVQGLPTYAFKGEDGDIDLNCPTEVPLTERRLRELSDLGFLPLGYYKNTDYAVFFDGQTTQKPKKYDTHEATENAAISARLPYIMASSRFAHYLKVMARDWIGAYKEAEELQDRLDRWIRQYVCSDPNPNEKIKAQFPLADASIKVTEVPGSPGEYNAVALLRPWLQLEKLNASLRMVAKLKKGNS